MSDYPPYVERGGDLQTGLQPFDCSRTRMYGFFVKGDAGAMQANLVDPCLNAPTRGALDYRVLSSHAMVTFAYTAHVTSVPSPADRMGWIPEVSATMWVPAAAVKKELGVYIAERLVVFAAYIVVDNPWSMASGREVFGFPKQTGPITIPTPPGAAPAVRFSADTLVLKQFRPSEEACQATIMAAERVPGVETAAPAPWTSIEEAFRAVVSRFAESDGGIIPGLGFLIDLFELATHARVPCVFLKQFRDVADGSRACYQAIVEAPSSVTALRGGGFLPGRYTFTTVDYASHPIVRDFGLPGTTVPAEFPFYVDMDFTAGCGTEVWKA